MRRREFIGAIALAVGATIAWPKIGTGQQSDRARRVAVLMGMRPDDSQGVEIAAAFNGQLAELGWTEGGTLRTDFRWAGGDPDRARAHAMELAAAKPEIMVAQAPIALSAVMQAARSTPIVFFLVTDPVARNFVPSVSRPGGTVTGFSSFEYSMSGKWLQTLVEIAPHVRRVALIGNPETTPYAAFRTAVQPLATSLGIELIAATVHDAADIERIVTDLAAAPNGGFIILPDSFSQVHRPLLVALAERHRLPAIYPFRAFTAGGGLISYGIDNKAIARRTATYVDRILKGENPGELPVQAPDKFELVINLKTAKTMGVTVPAALLARADEVIE
jgi:putative ABC transport system substrate-binding protein